ncbi:hemerythrin domain-containing protein [Sphingomonas sp. FARSPH]|nr:hemerythrin domain-containing protein [Sphingomonas sp. FARSPH]
MSAEHDELLGLGEELVACIAETVPDHAAVARLRWAMTRKLLAHLAKEDTLLYPRLKASRDPRAAAMATRFADEMGDLAEKYRAYIADWPAERIDADWRQFGAETRRILQALRQRIAREETMLYALLPASPPAVGRGAG